MKLLQFTDFHLRLSPPPSDQFHVQPFWSGDAKEIFSRIATAATDADALAFTGDAAHGGGKLEVAKFFDHLATAADGKPVFMVVGNHDVVDPKWKEHFHRGAQQYPNIRLEDGVYPLDEIDIVLINNQYLTAENKISSSWSEDYFPIPALGPTQAQILDHALSQSTDRPALALMHCPSHAIPPTPMGLVGKVPEGMERYRTAIHQLFDAHPRVRLVLSGHVHFNSTRSYRCNRVHQSLASATEYPYQVRSVECTSTRWTSHLFRLANESDLESAIKIESAVPSPVR